MEDHRSGSIDQLACRELAVAHIARYRGKRVEGNPKLSAIVAGDLDRLGWWVRFILKREDHYGDVFGCALRYADRLVRGDGYGMQTASYRVAKACWEFEVPELWGAEEEERLGEGVVELWSAVRARPLVMEPENFSKMGVFMGFPFPESMEYERELHR